MVHLLEWNVAWWILSNCSWFLFRFIDMLDFSNMFTGTWSWATLPCICRSCTIRMQERALLSSTSYSTNETNRSTHTTGQPATAAEKLFHLFRAAANYCLWEGYSSARLFWECNTHVLCVLKSSLLLLHLTSRLSDCQSSPSSIGGTNSLEW